MLAERGHGVILVARRHDRLQSLATELAREHGARAEAIAVDLEREDDREHLAAKVAELGLDVEVLVNNAGFGGSGKLHRQSPERLRAMVRVNCEALVDLQARYSPAMAERGRGAIINIASTAAFQPMPGTAAYAATKAFVLSLSEATHHELGARGVTVTAVCPGPVRTEFAETAGLGDVNERLPDLIWTDVETVARAAVEGAERGRRVVIPGLLNRAGALAGQHTPRALALPLVRRAWKLAG